MNCFLIIKIFFKFKINFDFYKKKLINGKNIKKFLKNRLFLLKNMQKLYKKQKF